MWLSRRAYDLRKRSLASGGHTLSFEEKDSSYLFFLKKKKKEK